MVMIYGGNNNNIWANSGDYESVTVNALPTVGITVSETSGITFSNNDGTVCTGMLVLLLSGTSASSYSWDNVLHNGVSFTANPHYNNIYCYEVQMEMDVRVY